MTVFAGTLAHAPGTVVPGFFCTGQATWRGPYPDAELSGYPLGIPNPLAAEYGTFALPPSVASQLANSDPNWWEFH